MASGLQSSGAIKMSEIREEFLDDAVNNRLNKYGDGESGLTPQSAGSGTQRKFSDYYGREFKVIKEVTNPDTQMPANGTRVSYNLNVLFTSREINARNRKKINIRDPGAPIGVEHTAFGVDEFGTFQFTFSGWNQLGELEINNHAKIWAPGGELQPYDGSQVSYKNGGNGIHVTVPSGTNYNLTINNLNELRGGGGAGAPGGKGGEGQYLVSGTPTKSIGTDGGAGGYGRGYISSSPYYRTDIAGVAAAAAVNNAGTGGTGGSGGDWGQNGSGGNAGANGTIETTPSTLPETNMSITIGAAGIGGKGETNGADGSGSTIINYDGFAIIALPGSGGQYNQTSQVNGAGQSFGVGSSTNLHQQQALKGGNGGAASGDYGGGGGGAVNNDLSRSLGSAGQQGGYSVTSGEIPFIAFGSFFATIAGDSRINQNTGGSGGSSGSSGLNNAGSDALRWGSGGGGAGYYGGDGGNGSLGGGGGGAAGHPRSSTPCAFFMNVSSTERWVRTANALDLRNAQSVSFTIIAANGGWGESPDPNEGIELEYSTNGTTWISLDYTDGGNSRPTEWLSKSITLSAGTKTAATYLRYRQRNWSGSFDIWGLGPMYVKYDNGSTGQVIDFGNSATYVKDSSSTIQFVAPSNYVAPSGYNGKPPPLFWTGGTGGRGAALVLFLNATGGIIADFIGDIPETYNITVPAGTAEIYAWAQGPGGGGAGSGESDPTSGGGGGAGGHSFAWWKASGVGNETGANSTGSAGSTAFGLAGKAVKFANNITPATYVFNNSGTVRGATS